MNDKTKCLHCGNYVKEGEEYCCRECRIEYRKNPLHIAKISRMFARIKRDRKEKMSQIEFHREQIETNLNS